MIILNKQKVTIEFTNKDFKFSLFCNEFVSHNNLQGYYADGYTTHFCGNDYRVVFRHSDKRITIIDRFNNVLEEVIME